MAEVSLQCRSCGVGVATESFRDPESARKYHSAAFCRRCQGALSLGGGS